MKRALFVLGVPLLMACGGSEPTPQTAADQAPPVTTEADPAPSDQPVAAADDAAWEGEAEAKSEKAPEGAGKTETRSMEVIAQVVKDNRKPVRDCFDKAKKEVPDLAGDMTIHFVVDPDGKVKKAELNHERSTLKAPPVVDCALKVIQAIQFPPSSRGMDTTVNYPFNFK